MFERKYEVLFPSERAEKDFYKTLSKLPRSDQRKIYQALQALADDPRPPGKRFKFLKQEMVFYQVVAHCRLRVGNYRIFYDIDDEKGVVLLLAIERRRERTYRRS